MNNRPSEQSYPTPVFRPPVSFSPASQQANLFSAANAVQCNWYLATPNPNMNPQSKVVPAGQGEWIRTLQAPATGPAFWVILSGLQILQKYFPQGEWTVGDAAISFDPSLMALSQFDWVQPLGPGTAPAGLTDFRTFTQKDVITRAHFLTPGAGTISASGTTVTGVGTAFTSFLQNGDVIAVNGSYFVVRSVASDTSLTLASTPPAWSAAAYSKGVDKLPYWPVSQIVSISDASQTYVSGFDFQLGSDGETIQWINYSHCPPPLGAYAVVYRYQPTYEITDLGTVGPVVKGNPTLSTVAAKLWKPQDNLSR